MNKIKTLAMALLMAAMFVSCGKELDVSPEDLIPESWRDNAPNFSLWGSGYTYGIELSFTDSKGKDPPAFSHAAASANTRGRRRGEATNR